MFQKQVDNRAIVYTLVRKVRASKGAGRLGKPSACEREESATENILLSRQYRCNGEVKAHQLNSRGFRLSKPRPDASSTAD